jgi:nucleotide-binding universal stress UspA family protein
VQAAAVGADLVMVGSHGHGGLHHLLVGSVTEDVLRRSTRPVIVVPAKG